jgi:hypothetical protein
VVKNLKDENKKLKIENKALHTVLSSMIESWSHINEGEVTLKCPICFEPYVYFPRIVGDQNACQQCKNIARRRV